MKIGNKSIEIEREEIDKIIEGLAKYVNYLNLGIKYLEIHAQIDGLRVAPQPILEMCKDNKNRLYEFLPVHIRGRLLEEEYQRGKK